LARFVSRKAIMRSHRHINAQPNFRISHFAFAPFSAHKLAQVSVNQYRTRPVLSAQEPLILGGFCRRLSAHNGLVAGSSPARPTSLIL
jgi:hypothetical protein